MNLEELQAENERLRLDLESCRQRELEGLRLRLVAAEEAAAHYRQEAERNAAVDRQIDAEYRKQVSELQERLRTAERMASVRPPRPTA